MGSKARIFGGNGMRLGAYIPGSSRDLVKQGETAGTNQPSHSPVTQFTAGCDFGLSVGDNAPTRTEDPDNQTNDIAKGGVCTGRDARTVRFVFVSICCGVARLTNIQISQHTP